MAIGIAMSGNGLGIVIMMPLTQFIIEWAGWRTAFLATGLIAASLAPLNAIFQRARPEDKGFAPDGDIPESPTIKKNHAKTATNQHWTLSNALRHRSFWMMCFALFCNPFATFTIVLHQVALVVEQGFEPMYVASVFGFIGIFAMAGRFLGGTFSDYIGRELAYSIFMGSFALAIFLLLILTPERSWILSFYVVLMGLGMGVGGAMFPPIIADLFPGPSLGRIMGVSSIFGGLGSGFGSWLAGYLHDITGNYTYGLFCALIAIAGAVVFVWIAAPRSVIKKSAPAGKRQSQL